MTFLDILPILLILLCLGGALLYLFRQKKKGTKCIGCPYCGSCPSARNGGCHLKEQEENENNSLQK